MSVRHRAILCNQNINILIESMEHLNRNIQLQRPDLGGNLQHADRIWALFGGIKGNSFNGQKIHRLKNFILGMDGWAVFTLRLLLCTYR